MSGKAGAGTPSYMAPELWQAQPFTSKVDVYAFGVVLNELMTRKAPFVSMEPDRVSDLVLEGRRPEVASGVPASITDVIASCWDADPARRPAFTDIQDALSSVLDGLGKGG